MPPIGLSIHSQIWNLTVSKKRLVTIEESIIEKRMLCVERPMKPKECCVTKQVVGMMANSTAKMQVAKARLENF